MPKTVNVPSRQGAPFLQAMYSKASFKTDFKTECVFSVSQYEYSVVLTLFSLFLLWREEPLVEIRSAFFDDSAD